jgi:L-lactate dehydrogenase complex protein LldG
MARAEGKAVSGRDVVFAAIRRSLGVTGKEAPRRRSVADRLATHPAGVIPKRGQLPPAARLDLFAQMVTAAAATMVRVPAITDIPAAVTGFLREHNLPLAVRRGDDALLASVPWAEAAMLHVSPQATADNALTAISRAFAAAAETGTLVLTSGPDNPTSLNFLPDNHIVVLAAKDIAGDYETVWQRLREKFAALPRTVNLITGPSRSADIEQTLILGAHGPRRLHVIVVGEAG